LHPAEHAYTVGPDEGASRVPRPITTGETRLQSPPEPRGEAERIRALHELGLLDTEPEGRFDRLTRLARRLFDVPTALVTLVDRDRQWFKSANGLDARELPRDTSFCGHAILADDILCIRDARSDERFADNPLVTGEPYIRFYAGCPVRSAGGHNLGTLCLIDSRPRGLDEDEWIDLRDLAGLVERELQLRELAQTDELTGLVNRRGFMNSASQSLHIAQRAGLDAAVVLIDLDGFKSINDTHGHAAGDELLSTFADRLSASMRASDVCGRLGGDEFAILLTGSASEDPERFVERICHEGPVAEVTRPDGGTVCFSHGVVRFDPARHTTVADLLWEADERMYGDKARA